MLSTAVAEFERVVELSERLSARGDRTTSILCLFYVMLSALAIRMCLAVYGDGGIEEAKDNASTESPLAGAEDFPRLAAVQKAVQNFTSADKSNNKTELWSALRDMRVLALCPDPEGHLLRMELVSENLPGRARVILLVELSLLAAELGDYGRAIHYASLAHTFGPDSWELYNLCVVEGLIALNTGKHREAVQYLDASIRACERDEYTSLSCGIRVPNLTLAQKLLHSGQRVEVLRHLSDCKDVWQFLRVKIDRWMCLIEAGEVPDFGSAGLLKAISYRLQMQWLRAYSLSLEKEPGVPTRKSPAEVVAGRNRLRAEYKLRRNGPPKP